MVTERLLPPIRPIAYFYFFFFRSERRMHPYIFPFCVITYFPVILIVCVLPVKTFLPILNFSTPNAKHTTSFLYYNPTTKFASFYYFFFYPGFGDFPHFTAPLRIRLQITTAPNTVWERGLADKSLFFSLLFVYACLSPEYWLLSHMTYLRHDDEKQRQTESIQDGVRIYKFCPIALEKMLRCRDFANILNYYRADI